MTVPRSTGFASGWTGCRWRWRLPQHASRCSHPAGSRHGSAKRLTLPDGPRDLPERQRTLRATIGWSYRLLDPAERDLLARLSPFIGGVRIDAAESIWGRWTWSMG